MSFAFLPLYTGDYLRDTRHLTPLKHGIYLLLLMHCWDQKGPLPLDEQDCAGIANCRSQDEIDALRYVLLRFFTRMDDGLYNKRMAEEVTRADEKSAAYREAGLRSAEMRRARGAVREAAAEQRLDRGSTAGGTPTPTPIPTLNPTPKETPPTPPSVDKSKKAGGEKDWKYPKIPPYVHDAWIDREYKAGRLKLRSGETYEQVKSRLIAEREAAK